MNLQQLYACYPKIDRIISLGNEVRESNPEIARICDFLAEFVADVISLTEPPMPMQFVPPVAPPPPPVPVAPEAPVASPAPSWPVAPGGLASFPPYAPPEPAAAPVIPAAPPGWVLTPQGWQQVG